MDIAVTINDERVNYTAHMTSAPDAYDGFGTISLCDWSQDGRTWRLVLIRDQHRRWQEGRYNSGMFYLSEPPQDASAIVHELWKRIAGQQ
jgi:hypothetical protein